MSFLNIDEGYIKFHLNWIPDAAPDEEVVKELIHWRNLLFEKNLIGVYSNGIGFGNISCRYDSSGRFIISGTQTGHIPELSAEHFTLVENFSIESNNLTCRGPVKASSESMTHAVFYRLHPQINAVVHVHHLELWRQLMHVVPTTAEDVPYGTPEMARAVETQYLKNELSSKKILVMAGHDGGIVSFGSDLQEAVQIILDYL